MKIIDANILLYSVNQDSPRHVEAKEWLEEAFTGNETIAFTWIVLLAFTRISTRPGIFHKPLSLDEAFDFVDEWLSQPCSILLNPDEKHAPILRELLVPLGSAGNLTSDAHLAAIAIQHGAELYSYDNDFSRFPKLRWKSPSLKVR